MKSYSDIEAKVLQWGQARGIVQHGKPMGQALKTLEEVQELLQAIDEGSPGSVRDALGDIWVTLVMCAATMDINLLDCMYDAYNEIKDRKGRLMPNGVFCKDAV